MVKCFLLIIFFAIFNFVEKDNEELSSVGGTQEKVFKGKVLRIMLKVGRFYFLISHLEVWGRGLTWQEERYCCWRPGSPASPQPGGEADSPRWGWRPPWPGGSPTSSPTSRSPPGSPDSPGLAETRGEPGSHWWSRSRSELVDLRQNTRR